MTPTNKSIENDEMNDIISNLNEQKNQLEEELKRLERELNMAQIELIDYKNQNILLLREKEQLDSKERGRVETSLGDENPKEEYERVLAENKKLTLHCEN